MNRRLRIASLGIVFLVLALDGAAAALERRAYAPDRSVPDALFPPPGELLRGEPDGPVADANVNLAFDLTGGAHGYFLGAHGYEDLLASLAISLGFQSDLATIHLHQSVRRAPDASRDQRFDAQEAGDFHAFGTRKYRFR